MGLTTTGAKRADHPELNGGRFAEAKRCTPDWLLSQHEVATAIPREQMLSGEAAGALEAALRRSFDPRRSGGVL